MNPDQKQSGLRIPLDKIFTFCSVDKKHYRLRSIQSCLTESPGDSELLGKLKRLVDKEPIGRPDVDEFFSIVEKRFSVCPVEDLELAGHRLLSEIAKIAGVSRVDKDCLHLDPDVFPELKEQIIHGYGETSFLLRLLTIVKGRITSARISEEIFKTLDLRVSELLSLSDESLNPELASHKELHSEMVLKDSWVLLKDAGRALSQCLNKEKAELARLNISKSLDVFRNELQKIEAYLSDKLIFIIRAKYTTKLPPHAQKVVTTNLVKLGKIYRNKMGYLHRLKEAPFLNGDSEIRASMEDLVLTILFSVQTVPYEETFSTPMRKRLYEQLRHFSLYATLLHDVNPFDRQRERFSDGIDFRIHYIPPVNGKTLDSVIQLLEGLNDSDRITGAMLRKLYDYIMVDIETWLVRNPERGSDRAVVIALKKWVIFSQLRERIKCALGSLFALKGLISDYRRSLGGENLYLPAELIDMLREVCYVFALLLQEEIKLGPLYPAEEHLTLIKRNKAPGAFLLRRTRGAIGKDGAFVNLSREMRELLDSFSELCREAMQHIHASELMRFEQMLREELDGLGFKGPMLDGLQDGNLLDQLMKRPWIKNQSWNRNILLHIVKICRSISYSINPAIVCENIK